MDECTNSGILLLLQRTGKGTSVLLRFSKNQVKTTKTQVWRRFFPNFLLLLPPQKREVQQKREFMANHKATKKDMRQSAKRRDRNRYYGKTTRNAIRDLRAIEDKAAAGEKLPEVVSMIDKLAKRGVIHKNKASNLKSKLTRRVKATA